MIGPVREGAAGDAALVAAALAGDGRAFASLFDGWFDRCFDVAFRIVRNRDVAAEVAQEVFLSAWRDLSTLRDHNAFGGWVLRTSRNRALNRLEKEGRSVALGDEVTHTAVDATGPAPDAAADALSGTGADLVWAACAALGERDASIVDLHLRHGLAAPELADALGVTANNASQLLFRLRGKMEDAIRSFVLWHQGRPSCPELQDALHRAGLSQFGPEAAKVAQRHAAACERCGERQRSALDPAALFAGVPLVLAGPGLRAKVISSLREEGVPVGAPVPDRAPSAPLQPVLADVRRREAAAAGDRRAGRRGVLMAAVLAALLLAGGAVLALRRDEPGTPIDASVVAAGSLTTLLGPTPAPTTSSLPPSPTTPAPTAAPRPTAVTGPSTTSPPTTGSPRPTTSTTTAATSTSVAAPPVVQRFAATAVPPRACANGEQQVQLGWSTTGASSVTLSGPGAPTKVQPPSGTAVACAPPGATAPVYVLTAVGPGGTATGKAAA